ncbi:porin [Rhizobium sp. SSA_523]|uniref:porin n=1 Tax=Rhizobium sp. SSA_523 TaxID=2952477 RepID=UPI0020912E58|nr:porin [Rhizobium sp. SSA_523]MCO5730845.1 porin [Rhizobium sp. SSA_523]WKC24334.1 porin [Rhizobium sp. SSA_523]
MTMRAIIFGSAAALVFGTVAHSADAIVAAEPEPMEYVRVCDAFGAGYFYIPGTETCLKISGSVRFQFDIDERMGGEAGRSGTNGSWNARTRGLLMFEAKSETELGALGSEITVLAWGNQSGGGDSLALDTAFFTLGGFRAGYGYNYWDDGLVGTTTDLGSNQINQIGYDFTAGALTAGAFLDELTNTSASNNDSWGVEGKLGYKFGSVTATLIGGYDVDAEEGAVRGIVSAAIGTGKLEGGVVYSSGKNAYFDASEWTYAVAYEAKITDKFKITPGFQYWDNIGWNNKKDGWKAGVAFDYAITQGLAAKVSVQYTDRDDQQLKGDGYWNGYFRLQRSF